LKKNLLTVVVVIVVAVALFFIVRRHGVPAAASAQQGAAAPDFSLTDLNGRPLALSSYRGKVVLLDFWATWCVPCREEIPHLIDLQNKYGSQGLQIVGVSMDDSPEPVRDFYQHFKMNYPVVMGDARTGELYGGVLGLPIAFVVGPDGKITSKHIGATDISVLEKEVLKLLPAKSS
jgi:thiol-disulfide isomerase/thioredoxin